MAPSQPHAISGGFCLRGFTLVEILAVTAIIILLVAVAVPALKSSMESGKKAKCLSNLKSLGQATLLYVADHDLSLPPYSIAYSKGGMTLWYLEIRPYLGAKSTLLPAAPNAINLPVFYCPSVDRKRGYPHTDYGGNSYVFALNSPDALDASPQTRLPRIASPSKIVLYSEVLSAGGSYPDSSWQAVAQSIKQNPDRWFPHRHKETINTVFCDGHAQNLPRKEIVDHFTDYFGSEPLWK